MSANKIGRYEIVKSLGKGGMGEVFLAYDSLCAREIALKKIRSDLKANASIKARFLREAQIAAKLSHPSIIPIHAIEYDEEQIPYYTMPYIQGETLRQILHQSRLEEKKGKILHPIGSSIPMLLRIFLNACQAVAYSHSHGILHRDLKPDNILIGKFGETMIVDWGLAEYAEEAKAEDFDETAQEADPGLTRPGKVVGTLAYIAPERASNQAASIQSDVYSLGVILYQILTLRTPFKRRDIKTFRKQMAHEKLVSALEIAPYRDIPSELSTIAGECLAFEKKKRIKDVPALVQKIERYLEGVPQWLSAKKFELETKGDWEFQEHILLAKHQALSEIPEAMEWVLMAVSKSAFWGNVKIEAEFSLDEQSLGIEVLFCVPQTQMRKRKVEGWSVKVAGTSAKLLHDQIEVAIYPDFALQQKKSHLLQIEMSQENVRVFIDSAKLFDHTAPLPMICNHVGLLLRDEGCVIRSFEVFASSYNALVNCLAIPDAFFAKRQMQEALEEYRRIAHGFLGRAEGRQALFRAGATLISIAKQTKDKKTKASLFDESLKEFDTLSNTPAAPLEYLGKSLVYHALHESHEEVKCLELSLRKAHLHPLMPICSAHVLFRLHEAAYESKFSSYAIALLALRLLPDLLEAPVHKELLQTLSKGLEPLDFLKGLRVEAQLAFWVGNIPLLKEYGAIAALSALQGEKKLSNEEIALFTKDFAEAKKLFSAYPKSDLEDEHHPLFVPYGCFLAAGRGEEAALRHFSDHISRAGPIPTSSLLAHFLCGKDSEKMTPFLFQKMELLRQRALYASCCSDFKKASTLTKKLCHLQNLAS